MKERLFSDTSNVFAIDYGDIILVGGKQYKVTGHERERRFGIDDPKFWVKRVEDLETGEKKIVKLSFFETFELQLGGVKIQCFRNPDKEGEILDLVKEHPHFMHGETYRDIKDNNIRVIEPIKGQNFFVYIDSLTIDYEIYFNTLLPYILKKLIKAFEAIRYLHVHGHRHGDIRNDHIIVEKDTGIYRWIDFDYDYVTDENPFSLDIFEIGNILTYAIGKGFHNLYMIKNNPALYGNLIDNLETRDFSILDKGRFINLRKLYPYIPIHLNDILCHFSMGAEIFYETAEEIIRDLNTCLYTVFES